MDLHWEFRSASFYFHSHLPCISQIDSISRLAVAWKKSAKNKASHTKRSIRCKSQEVCCPIQLCIHTECDRSHGWHTNQYIAFKFSSFALINQKCCEKWEEEKKNWYGRWLAICVYARARTLFLLNTRLLIFFFLLLLYLTSVSPIVQKCRLSIFIFCKAKWTTDI